MRTVAVKEMYVSEFPNVKIPDDRETNLTTVFRLVKEGAFKEEILKLRQTLATEGKGEASQAIKDALKCYIPVGTTPNGHAVKNLATLSGVICIDLDHTDERTVEVRELTKELPWVMGSYISPSGNGVKVHVRVKPEDIQADYPSLYAAVGAAVSNHVHHLYDEKCSILTQPCFYSYDPDAFFRPEAEEFVCPKPLEAGGISMEINGADTTAPEFPNSNQPLPVAPGFMARFLERFERENPFVRGKRNDIALKLGRVAAYNGFTLDELNSLSELFIRHYSNADFTAADIRKRVFAGYQHIIENGDAAKGANKGQIGVRVTYDPNSTPRVNNLSDKPCPLFAHFYLAVVAPVGSGKGVLSYTSTLLGATQDYCDKQRRQHYRFAKDCTCTDTDSR